jgi:hypothetical protein
MHAQERLTAAAAAAAAAAGTAAPCRRLAIVSLGEAVHAGHAVLQADAAVVAVVVACQLSVSVERVS